MEIGRIGAWVGAFTLASAADARPAAREIEELGYDTLWYPEGLGTRESFTNGAVLLGATERIRVASGIASVWARDPIACASAARVLDDAFQGRFLLGLGISHPRQVNPRGHTYARPVSTMSAYLNAMDDDLYVSPDGSGAARPAVPRMLAALRPPMLRLAAEKALGAHPFLVPVEHTRRARELMGEHALLVPEQKVVLETDPAAARARARAALAWYLDTPNYIENLKWLGFADGDVSGGGSDRLVDALVAWGDEETVLRRLREHLDAGANQVAVQPLGAEHDPFGLDVLRRLAPALEQDGLID